MVGAEIGGDNVGDGLARSKIAIEHARIYTYYINYSIIYMKWA